MNLERLKKIMADNGCQKVYVKSLSKNDDSKHQPYLGGNDVFNLFPTSDIVAISPGVWKKERFVATVDFAWVGESGNLFPAPKTKFILYPKYPEVRLSGFIRGCENAPSELMNTPLAGRLLFLSVSSKNEILGFVTAPDSALAAEFRSVVSTDEGVFQTFTLTGQDSRTALLSELRRIHQLGWIPAKQLKANGDILPCFGTNCGGNTLEAELNIAQNGRSEPDFMGWEVKSYGVKNFDKVGSAVITLMTPAPTEGFYKSKGTEYFLTTYGYPDRKGKVGRTNFSSPHKFGVRNPVTGLTLTLIGFDDQSGKIKSTSGRIALIDGVGNEAAAWSFASMLKHWNRKHNQACFVPSLNTQADSKQYRYGNLITLGVETDYEFFLRQMAVGNINYDPGIWMQHTTEERLEFKERSQFRMKSEYLGNLYKKNEVVDLMMP